MNQITQDLRWAWGKYGRDALTKVANRGRPMSAKRAALYVRVTTDAQTVENQIRELRRRLASFSMESRPGRPFRPLAPEMPASL